MCTRAVCIKLAFSRYCRVSVIPLNSREMKRIFYIILLSVSFASCSDMFMREIDYNGLDKVTDYMADVTMRCATDEDFAPSGKISPILYKLKPLHIDLTVSFYCLSGSFSGLCKSWWIKDHNIILLSLFFQIG